MIEFLIFTFVTGHRLKFCMEINDLSSPTPTLLPPNKSESTYVYFSVLSILFYLHTYEVYFFLIV